MEGIISKFNIYLNLIRINNPVGILLLIWPPFWVAFMPYVQNISFEIALIFILGTITSRSLGCLINDYFDRDIDKHVERTSSRPITSNKVSTNEVLILFVILSVLNLGLLSLLNSKTIVLGLVAAFFIVCYPLTKRFFPIPQLFLGYTFAFSTLMAHTAFTNTYPNNVTYLIFFITVVWVTMFDTVYALLDKKFDEKININSSALFFSHNTFNFILVMQIIFFILILILGYILNFSVNFYFCIFIAFLIAAYNQNIIKAGSSETVLKAFKNNQFIGLFVLIGIIFERIMS